MFDFYGSKIKITCILLVNGAEYFVQKSHCTIIYVVPVGVGAKMTNQLRLITSKGKFSHVRR